MSDKNTLKAALACIRSTGSQKLADALETMLARQAAPEAPTATKAEIYTLRRLIECAEKLDERPRPMCRDCADEDGTCPNSGLECDMRKLFAYAKSLHNKLASTGAAPEAPAADHESWMDCPDCDGYGRISSREKCARCNESGILPAATTASASDGSIYEAVSRRADPEGHAEAMAHVDEVLCRATAPSQAAAPLPPMPEPSEVWGRGYNTRDMEIYARAALAQQGASQEAQAAHAGATDKKLAHGHRDDYYLMANARRIAQHPIAMIRSMPNWALASELFATGSNSAHQICVDAGIDPYGYKVDRAAIATSEQKGPQ